jgi:hypothetical protein
MALFNLLKVKALGCLGPLTFRISAFPERNHPALHLPGSRYTNINASLCSLPLLIE